MTPSSFNKASSNLHMSTRINDVLNWVSSTFGVDGFGVDAGSGLDIEVEGWSDWVFKRVKYVFGPLSFSEIWN